jgi:ectoine hydroxylase-related dioxygenase (phytanoyl-CoA dioxygenase family)
MVAQSSCLSADQISQLDDDGYVVIPDVLSSEMCDRWSSFIDETWQREHDKPHTYDDEPGVQFLENLLQYSVEFHRCATDARVLEAVRSALGPEVVFSLVNARRTEPGYGNQPLHELDRRRGRPFAKCDAIWCLDPFTERNGTRVLPGSHHADERFKARMVDPSAPHPDQRVVVAPRGSVLVFNASLIHAGRTNDENTPRRSIQTQFVRLGQKPRFNWATDLTLSVRQQLPRDSHQVLGLVDGPSAPV